MLFVMKLENIIKVLEEIKTKKKTRNHKRCK